MVYLIVSRVLCLEFSHFGSVPNDNIVVVSSFYSEEELIKIKNFDL